MDIEMTRPVLLAPGCSQSGETHTWEVRGSGRSMRCVTSVYETKNATGRVGEGTVRCGVKGSGPQVWREENRGCAKLLELRVIGRSPGQGPWSGETCLTRDLRWAAHSGTRPSPEPGLQRAADACLWERW